MEQERGQQEQMDGYSGSHETSDRAQQVPNFSKRGPHVDSTTNFMYSHSIPNESPTDTLFTYSNSIPAEEKTDKISRNGTGLSSAFGRLPKDSSYYSQRSAFTEFMRDWWLELIACCFLLGAFIAIIVAAHEYQDHPLPNLPQGLTLNSIFSIFVVVLKAAMLLVLAQGLSHLKWTWFKQTRPLNDLARYDWASRGPLGSIWLLFSLRGKDLLATLGALLIIAHVVLDPMAQQVIRYYNCRTIVQDGNSTLPRTNAYMETGRHFAAGTNTISQDLQSAVNGGVFNPGDQVGYRCATGNCTFPDIFHTIGMHSVCTDVSNELSFANVTSADDYQTMNASLPSGLFTAYAQTYKDVYMMAIAFNQSLSSVEIILGPNFADPQTPRDLCTGSYYENLTNKDTNWICRGWGAARCSLLPAVYSITNASIFSGDLNETITHAATIGGDGFAYSGQFAGVADLSCLNTDQISTLKRRGYDIPDGRQWLPYNVTLNSTGYLQDFNANSAIPIDIVPKECIYQINTVSMSSLSYFFNTFFSGTVNPDGIGTNVAQQFYNDRGITFDSVNSMFQNISSSITTYIRQHGFANNSAPAEGQIWETNTCVRIRWAYIAYPAVLTILTLLFFIVMIIVTSRAQQGIHHDFKSSPLALLFHGLDENAIRRIENMGKGVESNEVEDLTDEAKGLMVRLQPTDRGWRFVIDDNQKTRVN